MASEQAAPFERKALNDRTLTCAAIDDMMT
jgi:hypothetical protein